MGFVPLVLWLVALGLQPLPQPGTHSATVSGRVVDAVTGRPVPGVVVTPAGSAVALTSATPLPPRALTNGQGEFVLRGLQKGTVFFTAVKSGYVSATFRQRRPGGSGQGLPIADGAQLNGVEIRMWRHASISGTIVDEAGDPAVGVRVQAFSRGFVAGRKRYTPDLSAMTDDRGIYRIANLMPGEYAIGVPSTQNAIPTEVMDAFFGPGGGATEGRRRDLAAELSAIGSPTVPAGSRYALAAGDQTVTLPPGTLVPQQHPQGLVIYPTLFYPAATALAEAGVIAVRSGDERGSVDIQMRPVRAARVTGIVMAPEGPAPYVGIRLVPAAEDVVESLEVATTMTNGTGAFTFPAVPQGQYVLTVLRPPRAPNDPDMAARMTMTAGGAITVGSAVPRDSSPPPPPAIPSDATLYAQTPLAVTDAEVSGVIVPLGAAPRMSGRVEFEGSADKPAGAALTGIRINLDPADGSRIADRDIAFQTGHPDEDGRFRTFGVPPGKYVVRVNPPAGWFLKGVMLAGTDLSDAPFDLRATDLEGVTIVFTDRPAGLTGAIRAGQAADPDAVVLVFPTDSSSWPARGPFPRRMRTARADKEGRYSLIGLPSGEYHVIAVHEDAFADWQDPALLAALARAAQQVRILDGEQRTQDLTTTVIR